MLFFALILTLWLVIGLCAWWSVRSGRDRAVRCAKCSYDLGACDPHGTERCPECGMALGDAGVEHRGPNAGRTRRRLCFAIALVCALGMGFLVLLRYPPVMQTLQTHRQGSFVFAQSGPSTVIATEYVVEHPGYATSPLEYVVPSLRGPRFFANEFVLSRPGVNIPARDLRAADNPGVALLEWTLGQTPPIKVRDQLALARAVDHEGIDTGTAIRRLTSTGLASRPPPFTGFSFTLHTTTAPAPQHRIAKALGLVPSIGADWAHTTWLQYSNIAWYVLPSAVVVVLFWRVRVRTRRDAQRAAAGWRAGAS